MDFESVLQAVDSWYSHNQSNVLYILFILASALMIKFFGSAIIRKLVIRGIKSTRHKNPREEKLREDTIIGIISGALAIVVWPLTAMLIISQLGVDIAPLIAGAGIAGVALGFGAQSLVKDIISGLFIIIENQYKVGDVVSLDDTAGLVERITLRVTVLRDLDGIVHHVPNGVIERTSNFSKDYSGINLNVGVAYDSDLDKVIGIINEVGEELAKDKSWKKDIIKKPSFERVDNFGDNSIDIKITGSVQPLKQWNVTGELRKRLKIAFDKESIEIPFPQRVIHQPKP
jgi:small conductance mechanosensitive channel